MTPRSVLAVDFKEIGAVEVRCKCGAVTAIPVPRGSGFHVEHFTCVGCNSMLWFGELEGGLYKKVKALIEGISAWQNVEGVPFTLGFSIDASAPASGGKD